MKTKYLAFAGIISIAAIFCFFKLRQRSNKTKQTPAHKKAKAEKHIRDIMKKSKLAV
jgi:Na+/melibiose symporter-like transporter